MIGVLNINKPAGWTSRDAVNRVQRMARPAKVGHAGTLDPLATGVLVVCVGGATRLIEYVQRMPKRYHATFQLGVTSVSDDTETELTPLEHASEPSAPAVEQATTQFVGTIQQRPPAFSAIKVKGQQAYRLARRGEAVELAARPVVIHALQVVRYRYPELELDIHCGSGTYVRSLGRDLAETLGTGAVMSGLVRTAIGQFNVADSVSPATLEPAELGRFVQPPATAIGNLMQITLQAAEVEQVRHGRTIERNLGNATEVAAIGPSGDLVAILRPRDGRLWGPRIVLPAS